MTKAGLKKAVAESLGQEPGLTARRLASRLKTQGIDADKSRVNSVLYRYKDAFRPDSSVPPRWYLGPSKPEPGVARSPYAATGLKATNWKVFEHLEVDFSKINLVFGENSSGKSSLLQALLVLKQSWRHGSLVLNGEVSFGSDSGDYDNVVHGHDYGLPIELGTSWSATPSSGGGSYISMTARAVDDPAAPVYTHWIEQIAYVGPEGPMVLWAPAESLDVSGEREWDWFAISPGSGAVIGDDGEVLEEAFERSLFFTSDDKGFPDLTDARSVSFPGRPVKPADPAKVAQIRTGLQEAGEVLGSLVHIGPMRHMPNRVVEIGPDDQQFEYIARLAEHSDLRHDVNEWMGRFDVPYLINTINLQSRGSEKRIVLELLMSDGAGDHTLELQLQDVGFGISQLLPIVVQLLGNREKTILIEEPEAHVHPRLQAVLGDLFVTSAQDYGNVLIVETHSEPLLLRLQRRIAERRIDHQDVKVLHIIRRGESASAEHVPIRADGQLDYQWPGGFFDDRMDDLIAILDPQPEE